MRVVVPTPSKACPAVQALTMEGIGFTWVDCVAAIDYGGFFSDYWNEGDPFIIVEWDICPWPGALAQLAECDCKWGAFRYPLNRGNLATSFGIGKYTPSGPAPEDWATTAWDRLDGAVIPHLRKLYGSGPCVHEPPCAHARREPI